MFIFKSIGSKDVLLPVINRRVHEWCRERERIAHITYKSTYVQTYIHIQMNMHISVECVASPFVMVLLCLLIRLFTFFVISSTVFLSTLIVRQLSKYVHTYVCKCTVYTVHHTHTYACTLKLFLFI